MATWKITWQTLAPTLTAPDTSATAVAVDPATGKLDPAIVPMSPATEAAMQTMSDRVEVVEQFAAGAPGGVQRALRTVATHTEAVPGERLRVDATAGPVVVTLPPGEARTLLDVKKVDATDNTVTLLPAAGETVERGPSLVLDATGTVAQLVGTGTGWDAFGRIAVLREVDVGDVSLWFENALA